MKQFIVRIVQLLGLGLIGYGLLHSQDAISSISNWIQEGFQDHAEMAIRTARVTVPLYLGGLLLWIPQWFLQFESKVDGLKRNPGKPWLALRAWEAQHIRNSNKVELRALGVLWGLWLFVLLPVLLSFQSRNATIALAVALAICLLVVRMVWMTWRWKQAELKFAPLPGLVGGEFTGAVILKETFPKETVFHVTLKCDKTRRTRKNSTTQTMTTQTIWSETLPIAKTLQAPTPGTTAIPFSFAIPHTCVQTEFVSREPVIWFLTAEVADGTPGMQASFEVPIFRTAESKSNSGQHRASEVDDFIQPYVAKFSETELLDRYHLKREPFPNGGERISFNHWDSSIFWGLTLVSVVCLAIVAFLFSWLEKKEGAFIASAIPGFLGGMCIFGMWDQWTWKSCILLQPFRGADDEERKAVTFFSGPFGWRPSASVESQKDCEFVLHQFVHTTTQERWDVSLVSRQEGSRPISILAMLKNQSEAREAMKLLVQMTGIGTKNRVIKEIRKPAGR